jgi:uncharacterized peroxidase-related enzyme
VTFIETIPENEAAGETARIYQIDRAAKGFLPNYTRAFSHRPDVYEAWANLNKTIKAHMDPRRYELATMGAALELRSSYCSLAHGERLLALGSDEAEVRSLTDLETSPLDGQERAVAAFGAKIARSATSVTEADIDQLRSSGLTDPEIFDVAAAAAARCFFSKLLDAVGARPDSAFIETIPGLVDVLTVGRPIDDSE